MINQIHNGDCIEVMRTFPANFIDTIITDPPYGIGFMGKEWDRFDPEMIQRRTVGYNTKDVPEGLDPRITKPVDSPALYAGLYDQSLSGHRKFQEWCCAWATEALRIAKPGAMMLVSGGTRTFHRMTAGLEDAGWEIRDCLMWLYGSGFPKSLDISKAIDKAKGAEREVVGVRANHRPNAPQNGPDADPTGFQDRSDGLLTAPATDLAREWNGWGTALKPAWEPIIVAMKPLDGTFAENAERHGVAGLNVDGGRIGTDSTIRPNNAAVTEYGSVRYGASSFNKSGSHGSDKGRWPANLLLDEEAAAMLDGQSGPNMHGAGAARAAIRQCEPTGNIINKHAGDGNRFGDTGGASRFFYVAKASRSERNEGCEGLPEIEKRTLNDFGDQSLHQCSDGVKRTKGTGTSLNRNHHPTVKPLKLMEYLCTLTKTPTGGIVLDPFAGSGSTLIAAERTGRPWVGIEMNPEYVAIANARLAVGEKQMRIAV